MTVLQIKVEMGRLNHLRQIVANASRAQHQGDGGEVRRLLDLALDVSESDDPDAIMHLDRGETPYAQQSGSDADRRRTDT